MKRMKKLAGILLVLIMVFALSVPSFALDGGSITINGVTDGVTYSVYRLLDLTGYNTGTNAYTYEVNAAWQAFFATAEAKTYISIDSSNHVTWNTADDDATLAAFATLALNWAKDPAHPIAPVKTSAGDPSGMTVTGTTGVFSDLTLGYYLVDSTAGALCGLTTTNPDASVNAKNAVPTIDKQVQEDLTGMWGDVNTADIGQIVNFMTIIHVAAGAENYVIHDQMGTGLTFEHDVANARGVTVIKHVAGSGAETTLTENNQYTVLTAPGDGCTFGIEFSDAFVASLKPNDRLLVYYNAMLNRNAVIAGEGNINKTWMEYGEGRTTTPDQTVTKTFAIDIIKTDDQNTLIDGAEFKIYDKAEGGNEIAVVELIPGESYRRARSDETGVSIVVKDGKVRVVGFDNGTYYLKETVVPGGYTGLSARKEFIIADASLDAVFNADIYSTGSGVHVVNRKGNMLPETGGMGTVLFVTFGMLTVLGTGVLLVTKKRMAMIED